ncbi:alpha/beta fold hydrolase [Umezawaea sp. NPDC059074]|uniref:alpha/beta fold hydrolase n=1 Tax=Umezawaea sp. NPDC059074 TaxID=3346716 RepID=UPI003690784E
MITAIRDTTLAWDESGDGPVAVWAHPLTSSGSAPLFDWTPVAADHRLVRYDARGHGRSGSGTSADFTFDNLARDLLALLDVLSPDAPVSGIGASLGTATLLHAVVQAPERFDRLVLAVPPTAWEARSPQRALYESMAALVEEKGAGALEDLLRDAPAPTSHRIEVAEDQLPALLRGVGASDLPPRTRVAALRLPVLLLAWEGDPVHPVASAVELASLIPGAELEVVRTAADAQGWSHRAAAFLAV